MTNHSAPRLAYPVARSAVLGSILLAVWLAGAVASSLWFYFLSFSLSLSLSISDWRAYVAAACVLTAGVFAAYAWLRCPSGQLSWDGQFWRWQSLNYAGGVAALELSVALDLRSVLWLRLENSDGAALWLWAEKSVLPNRWLDLRRAVYSAAATTTSTDASNSPAGHVQP